MKKFVLLTSFLFSGICLMAQASSFSDDFESYADDAYVAANSTVWKTWSNRPGTTEDAKVSTEQAFSGTKSMKLLSTSANGGPTDLILPFGGRRVQGNFLYEMQMYVVGGTGAYFNYQGSATIGSEWAFSAYFYKSGTVIFTNGAGQAVVETTFPHDEWFSFSTVIDLTLNVWEIRINDQTVGRFANTNNAVASIDLFPLDPDGGTSTFYVDDVAYDYVPAVLKNLDAAVTQVIIPPKGLKGKDYRLQAQIRNIGTTRITGFDITWTDGNTTETKTVSGINVNSLGYNTVTFDQLYNANDNYDDITVTLSNPNGTSDEDPINNVKSTTVEVIVPAEDKAMFVEEGTGTWCGWCPRGTVWMDRMHKEYTDYFVGVAVHNNDPMAVVEYDNGVGDFPGFTGYPGVIVDRLRVEDPSNLENDLFKQVILPPVAKLTNDVDYNAVTRQLNIKVNALMKESVSGDYRLNVIVREDNVTGSGSGWAQANYYANNASGPMGGYEALPNPVPAASMVYDFVARAILGGFDGKQGSLPATMTAGQTYSDDFTYTIPAGYDETEIVVVSYISLPNGEISTAKETPYTEFAVTGVESVQDHPAFEGIAPNPFSDVTFVNLDLQTAEAVSVRLMNSTGQVISERDYGTLSGHQLLPVRGENLANGMYFVKVQIGDQFLTRSVVINR